MRNDRARLLDVREAIERIERHTAGDAKRSTPTSSSKPGLSAHLEIIVEAVRGLSQELRDRHPEVRWAEIVALRNILAHHYFGIDLDAAWRVVDRDLPPVKCNIDAILDGLAPAPGPDACQKLTTPARLPIPAIAITRSGRWRSRVPEHRDHPFR